MGAHLRVALLRRAASDQEARERLIAFHIAPGVRIPRTARHSLKALEAMDTDNTAWLKAVVQEHGWPGRSLVGEDAANAAWLLIQHADHDLEFQRTCLDLLEQAAITIWRVVDRIFTERRLAEIYDPLDPDRRDLDAYAAMVDEFGARSVLDIGCGTGTFACQLANRGLAVTAVDPAAASLEVARSKPGAGQVRWIYGAATDLPPLEVDLVTMTGNVAQVFLTDEQWASTLRAAYSALRPGGRLAFETRNPSAKAWLEWNHECSRKRAVIPGVGGVLTWVDLIDVSGNLISFRWTFIFESDGARLTSDSTLRFRHRDELTASLAAAGYRVDDVREAPDRLGRELVFIARRPG